MPNVTEGRLENRLLKGVSGKQLRWRHMESGSGNRKFSREGVRYFAIQLDDEFANELEQEGWPIIWQDKNRNNPNTDEVELVPYFKIFIKDGTRFPCDIYLVNAKQKTKTRLDEHDLDDYHMDSQRIESVDIYIRPYYWTFDNDHGIKAQVQEMNILLSQSGLEDDYEIVY